MSFDVTKHVVSKRAIDMEKSGESGVASDGQRFLDSTRPK